MTTSKNTLERKVIGHLQKIRGFSYFDGARRYRIMRGFLRTEEGKKKMGRALKEFTKLLGACTTSIYYEAKFACAPGCHQCCYSMPWTWMNAEREIILGALRQDRYLADRVRSVSKPMLAEWDTLREHFGLKPKQDCSASFDLAWEELLFPCPLLDTESGLCLIYRVRPIQCRLTANYEICEHPSKTSSPIIPEEIYGIEEELFFLHNSEKAIAASLYCKESDSADGEWGAVRGKGFHAHTDWAVRKAMASFLTTIGQVDQWLYGNKELTSIPLIHVIQTT